MPSVPSPKAARAAVVVAFVLALVSGASARSGPIMLLGICAASLFAAVGILRRRAWSAWGFAFLLALSILAMLIFAVTGQSSGSFIQVSISIIIYAGLAGLFLFAGIGLSLSGAKRGSPLLWIVLALTFSVPFLFFRPVSILNSAMNNTLLPGDSVLVDRFDKTACFGELIAFHYPLDPSQTFVRRVIGLPGDRIRINDGQVLRNGSLLTEPYVTDNSARLNYPADSSGVALQSGGRAMLQQDVADGEIRVPAGRVFVLGDARANAFDSRNFGLVPFADIIGRPKLIYDSLEPDPADKDIEHATHPPSHRWARLFKKL